MVAASVNLYVFPVSFDPDKPGHPICLTYGAGDRTCKAGTGTWGIGLPSNQHAYGNHSRDRIRQSGPHHD